MEDRVFLQRIFIWSLWLIQKGSVHTASDEGIETDFLKRMQGF